MNYLVFTIPPRAEAQGGMVRGNHDVTRRAKSGGFDAFTLGFTTDAPCGSTGSFIDGHLYSLKLLPVPKSLNKGRNIDYGKVHGL